MYLCIDKKTNAEWFYEDKDQAIADGFEPIDIGHMPPATGEYGGQYVVDRKTMTVSWRENPPPIEPEPQPPSETEVLKAQLKALSERGEFIEDCIAEMATQVYGGV